MGEPGRLLSQTDLLQLSIVPQDQRAEIVQKSDPRWNGDQLILTQIEPSDSRIEQRGTQHDRIDLRRQLRYRLELRHDERITNVVDLRRG